MAARPAGATAGAPPAAPAQAASAPPSAARMVAVAYHVRTTDPGAEVFTGKIQPSLINDTYESWRRAIARNVLSAVRRSWKKKHQQNPADDDMPLPTEDHLASAEWQLCVSIDTTGTDSARSTLQLDAASFHIARRPEVLDAAGVRYASLSALSDPEVRGDPFVVTLDDTVIDATPNCESAGKARAARPMRARCVDSVRAVYVVGVATLEPLSAAKVRSASADHDRQTSPPPPPWHTL